MKDAERVKSAKCFFAPKLFNRCKNSKELIAVF